MAFDKPTRNRLAKFVADARDVITDEFTEQFKKLYGISATGDVTSIEDLRHLDDAGLAIAERLRERIDYLVKTHPDEENGEEMAVKRLAREQAFTILNRFAAVRMAEKRGLIEESVGQGYQSKGFTTYEYVAGSGIGEIYERYRRFLFCLFDELTIDLGVLFDRTSPSSLLFPRETSLLALLDLFQAGDLERLWEEDETVGWIYQYYNDPEERKKMRKESAAPRNSRELAVRNQFFTPRYVVEFLTDNTLGRIWYEMTRGQTRLADQCRYLVRRPTEIFLKPVDEYGFDKCRDWVKEVLSGNFAAAEVDATWEEMSSVALALDGYDVAEQLGLGDVHDYVRERGDRAIEQGIVDDATLLDQWLLLFSVQRGTLREGLQGRDEKYATAARATWEAWVRTAKAGSAGSTSEALSQEELLRQPVFISPRPIKDPREIRLLDPACGSMHFGLYAFDLFEAIYEEAWEKAGACDLVREDPALQPLQESYESREDYLRDVPRLIIEHNIHGVDIDPRAVQIAGLSLWLRAQRAWQVQEITPAERPRVRRSNIVCAEPMPGSPEMLEEFVQTLDLPLLGELVKTVFEKMELAGEAGSLLKIEEEIRSAIDAARKAWDQLESKPRELFSTEELNQTTNQPELSALEKSLTTGRRALTADFWETAEQQVIDALRAYSEQADADSYQRRLFADDAARGFAFIDLCRKRYDAVVMNPPFGKLTDSVTEFAQRVYKRLYIDIYACFVRRMGDILNEGGLTGIISSRSFMVGRGMEALRPHLLGTGNTYLHVLWDLGNGVLDGAMVETAAYTYGKSESEPNSHVTFWNDMDATKETLSKPSETRCFLRTYSFFRSLPKQQFIYEADEEIAKGLSSKRTFEPHLGRVTKGLSTCSNERFVRCLWEVPNREIRGTWEFLSKGGEYRWLSCDLHLALKWNRDGRELAVFSEITNGNAARARQSSAYYFKPAVCFSGRSQKGFSARWLPSGCIFDTKSPVIVPKKESALPWLVPLLMSSQYQQLISLQSKFGSYDTSAIGRLPVPPQAFEEFENSLSLFWHPVASLDRGAETNPSFLAPHDALGEQLDKANSGLREVGDILAKYELQLDPSVESLAADAMASHECFTFGDTQWVSYALGSTLGRWDIRYATSERQPPELPDPFDPLPVCPPGMLQNGEGLPAEPADVPFDYPLRISWSGILVDDENHPEDIVARVEDSLKVIWKDNWEAIEEEACDILGVKSLRDYFRRPAAFFADHLKRYSKSRRQAPIYWPLSTRSGSYTLWLYYHRLTDQTLHTCLADFLDPKIKKVQSELDGLTQSGNDNTRVGELRDFLDELHDLRDEIERVIKLPWKPNLNDGVIITASPLHKLFGLSKWQKALEACWKKLEKGDYDWAHLAHSIWPQRVEKVCETDRSIAIAHDLEHLCKVEPPKPKKKRAAKKAAKKR